MARTEKTVFISYRRTDVYTALAVYENLKNQGYDVFFDYRSISSGDFEQIITSNIRARAHFLLILTPTALDRCNEPGDWLRREIEFAIDEKRNIIPLFFKGFRFGEPLVSEKLTGKLKNISRYNGLNIHEDYFDEAMQRLRTQYLNIPLNTVLHPVSTEVQQVVREEQVAADKALEHIEDVQELVKQAQEKTEIEQLESQAIQYELMGDLWNAMQTYYKIKRIDPFHPRVHIKIEELEREQRLKSGPLQTVGSPRAISWRLLGFAVGGLLVIAFLIWGASKLLQKLSAATSQPSRTPQTNATITSQPERTDTLFPTETTIPPTSAFVIGSTITSDQDNMILLYVPDGEFTMGSKTEDALAECQKFRSECQLDWFKNEEPPHTVSLDAFWIDQTEVTNKMYAVCVDAGVCRQPTDTSSFTHSSYYGNAEYDNYPVIYVDWNMAKTYCEWVDRRLPTEAEWEKAARGENDFVYPWGNEFDGTKENFCDKNCSSDWADKSSDDGFVETSPVGNYQNGASPYGALDIAGNVWEWVNDWYDAYPGSTVDNSEYGTKYRVLRGGSWYNVINGIRSAIRYRNNPTYTNYSVGFRCAMSATP